MQLIEEELSEFCDFSVILELYRSYKNIFTSTFVSLENSYEFKTKAENYSVNQIFGMATQCIKKCFNNVYNWEVGIWNY